MAKVSFRMASASRVGIRCTDQHGAEELSVRPHRGPVDHHAKRMLRTEGTPYGHSTCIWARFRRGRRPVSRKTRPVMCPGDGALSATGAGCRRSREAAKQATTAFVKQRARVLRYRRARLGRSTKAPHASPGYVRCIGKTPAGANSRSAGARAPSLSHRGRIDSPLSLRRVARVAQSRHTGRRSDPRLRRRSRPSLGSVLLPGTEEPREPRSAGSSDR
jgi:hypothetical protein